VEHKGQHAGSRGGARINFTFLGGFNPVMEITGLTPEQELRWRCVTGRDPRKDNGLRFFVAANDGGRTRLRFWQEYAVELGDDSHGFYN
jgi:hypothetical protein